MDKSNKPQIVLASNNAGKIREVQALLPGYEIIPQSEIVQTEAEETGLTFAESPSCSPALSPTRYC
jgi:inosine/xanthosine triphosphate pyrophosphatase family protein